MTGKRQRKDDDEGIRAKSGLFKASADATVQDGTWNKKTSMTTSKTCTMTYSNTKTKKARDIEWMMMGQTRGGHVLTRTIETETRTQTVERGEHDGGAECVGEEHIEGLTWDRQHGDLKDDA